VSSARTCRFSETALALNLACRSPLGQVFPGGQEAQRQEQRKLSELPKPPTPRGARSYR
jgi:hypothetical protein